MPSFSTVCVDANLVIKLVDQSASGDIEKLFEDWIQQDHTIVAPYLLRYEITNIIRQMQRHGQMTEQIANDAIRAMVLLPIFLSTDANLHLQAMIISNRFNLPASYDAHYIALADGLGCEFWTADRRLARAVQHELGWVRLFE